LFYLHSLLSLKPRFENQLGELKEKHVENYGWYSGKGFEHLKRVGYISMCRPKVLEPFTEQGIEVG